MAIKSLMFAIFVKKKMIMINPENVSLQNLCTPFLMSYGILELKIIKIWQLEVGQNKNFVCYRKKYSFAGN